MIQPNELRLGNFVYSNEQDLQRVALKVIEVGLFFTKSCRFTNLVASIPPISLSYGKLEPIPLTTEILEAAGLINKKLYWTHREQEFEINEHYDKAFILSVNDGEYNYGKPFKYLHQLQNLYHSITGEELEINADLLRRTVSLT